MLTTKAISVTLLTSVALNPVVTICTTDRNKSKFYHSVCNIIHINTCIYIYIHTYIYVCVCGARWGSG